MTMKMRGILEVRQLRNYEWLMAMGLQAHVIKHQAAMIPSWEKIEA